MKDRKRIINRGGSSLWKGLAAGLIGGLAASWTMNRFQDVWIGLAGATASGAQSCEPEKDSSRGEQAQMGGDEEQADVTVKAASAISEGIFNHKLTKSEKKIAGPVVHYAFGTTVGGLYGAIAELAPGITAGAGLPFGASFWLIADETAVPLLGLSKWPAAYPLSTHAYALASHFVYGLTTELVRRAARSAMGSLED